MLLILTYKLEQSLIFRFYSPTLKVFSEFTKKTEAIMSDQVNLCMGCMSYSAGKIPCPSCGFDPDRHFKSPLVLPVGTRLYDDRYILGRVVGKPGIFGITYISWDTFTETKVAIKEYFPSICVSRHVSDHTPVPHSTEDENFFKVGMEDFTKEARKLLNFDHPNIVRVRDFFEANKTIYMVMNYYEGEPFLRYLANQGGKLDWKTSCIVMYQLLDGLKEVHSKHYLHHDIKPHHIVYIKDEKRPVLISFSTARFAFYQNIFGSSETILSKYSPIENYVSNIKEGPWTDIYSCGATFYRMISGQDPPSAPERMILDQLVYSSKSLIEMPDEVARAVLKALSIDVSERFHSVTEFQNILKAYTEGLITSENKKSAYDMMSEDLLNDEPEADAEEYLIEDVTEASKTDIIKKIVIGSIIALLLVLIIAYLVLWENNVILEKKNNSKSVTESRSQGNINESSGFNGPNGMSFVYIQPGEFMMGSPETETERDDDEIFHEVKITKGFYLQSTEVTQSQWAAVMGSSPSSFKSCGPECPMESVSWESVQSFIFKLNEDSKDYVYRLPTEAEWEYACRAGTNTSVYNGNISVISEKNATLIDDIGWYGGNSCVGYAAAFDCSEWGEREKSCHNCGPHPVASKEPNAWGLYDMIGNVGEWCSDWYEQYEASNGIDPKGPASGNFKVFRGGSWYLDARFCRAAVRSKAPQTSRFFFIGFRLAADRKMDNTLSR